MVYDTFTLVHIIIIIISGKNPVSLYLYTWSTGMAFARFPGVPSLLPLLHQQL